MSDETGDTGSWMLDLPTGRQVLVDFLNDSDEVPKVDFVSRKERKGFINDAKGACGTGD